MRASIPAVLVLLLVNDLVLLWVLGDLPRGVGTALALAFALTAPILALAARSRGSQRRRSLREEVEVLRERVDDLED
jgi:hypothetical protein